MLSKHDDSEPQSPQKPQKGTSSADQKVRDAREDKRNLMKKFIKSKLSLSNINDLVLCDREYNYGLFGCMSNDQEKFLGVTLAPGVEPRKKRDDGHLSLG